MWTSFQQYVNTVALLSTGTYEQVVYIQCMCSMGYCTMVNMPPLTFIYGLSLNLQASKGVYYMYVFACERAWKIPVHARVRSIAGNSGHI